MSSISQFKIIFDKSSATYEPDEIVSGKIILDTRKEKTAKRLYFIASGGAFVHYLSNDALIDLSNTEEYLNFSHDIFGSPDCQTGHKIPQGHNEYTFSFRLPREIPSSFEHPTGFIRYTIKVIIERPWKFDYECKTAFSVVTCLDLNLHPEKCLAINDEVNRNFKSICCCRRSSMNTEIIVPCSGYVPGQVITTAIQYASTPHIPISKLSTKILRKVHLHTPSTTLSHKNVVKKTRHSHPFPVNGRIVSEILVPPIAPSNLKYCNLIDLEYELVVSFHVSRPYSKIKRSYPILIGTVPLRGPALTLMHNAVSLATAPFIAQPAIVPHPPSSMAGKSSESDIPMQELSSSAPLDIPPPSYEEGLYKTLDIKNIEESKYVFGVNNSFAPKYPVYTYPALGLPSESP